MQIVIPMAGKGSRFINAGYTMPKPLISIHGKTMIAHVSSLFPKNSNVLYIGSTQQVKKTNMRDQIKKINPLSKVVAIPFRKKGPVYGIVKVEKDIYDKEQIIVNYCDFTMIWNFKKFKKYVHANNLDGCIVCYKGFHPHLLGKNYYASVLTNKSNDFLEIKEKHSYTENKMDSWQSCGTYYFRSGEILKKYCHELLKKNISYNGEYYVSMVYNLMKRDGLKIKVYPIDFFCQWGTPEDLSEYMYYAKMFQ